MLADREFINSKLFDEQWAEMGCDDDDLAVLQRVICDDPHRHPVIQGTGGIRKIRIVLPGRGKRGGARVLYVDFFVHNTIALLAAYSKSEKSNLKESEKKILRNLAELISKNLEV